MKYNCFRETPVIIHHDILEAKMIIHIATPELVVLEAETCDLTDGEAVQAQIRSVLEGEGLEPWSSIEVEDFTYRNQRLIFATPIKVFIPSFLARLLD